MEVDSKLLGKPYPFDGKDESWADWSFVFRAFMGSQNSQMALWMEQAERSTQEILNVDLDAEKEAASRKLYFVLATLLRCEPHYNRDYRRQKASKSTKRRLDCKHQLSSENLGGNFSFLLSTSTR